jgi:hypothetical protein
MAAVRQVAGKRDVAVGQRVHGAGADGATDDPAQQAFLLDDLGAAAVGQEATIGLRRRR